MRNISRQVKTGIFVGALMLGATVNAEAGGYRHAMTGGAGYGHMANRMGGFAGHGHGGRGGFGFGLGLGAGIGYAGYGAPTYAQAAPVSQTYVVPTTVYQTVTRSYRVPVRGYQTVEQTRYVPVTSYKAVTDQVQVPVTTYQTIQRTEQVPTTVYRQVRRTCGCSFGE